MIPTSRKIVALALVLLAGCGEREVILPGERIDIRASAETANEARAISLPAAQVNAEWTHRGGSATHRIGHPALGPGLTLAFAADIGAGDTRRARITADPVVADGRVFAMDSGSRVTAVSTSGAVLWSRDLVRPGDTASDASGGGLAVAGGRLFVTTAFGDLVTLDAATGAEIWAQDLNAPGGSAPTVAGDLVYIAARDSRAWAIERDTGLVRWTIDSIPGGANFAGGAGVAVGGEMAVIPFPSGEVLGVLAQGGLRRWSSVLAGARPGQALGVAARDIAGDPVIDGEVVYVGNVSGRTVAFRLADGDRLWTATEGATSPVVPVAGSVFLVNDLGDLVRLDAGDGSVIWRVPLPAGEMRRGRAAHYGPILAGGRLIVASSDGLLRQFDPVSGVLLGAAELPGGAASHPVVAGQILYVVSRDGQLLAFR